MFKRSSGAFLWILVFQLIAYFIGQMTKYNIGTWYETLNKSTFNPAPIVFSIVWGILYVQLSLVGWSLWLKRSEPRGKVVLSIYGLQMFMNWAWTPLFFSFHLIAIGFYWIMLMVVITLFTISISWKHDKFTSILLMPYWFWLLFAGYLNGVIWLKN